MCHSAASCRVEVTPPVCLYISEGWVASLTATNPAVHTCFKASVHTSHRFSLPIEAQLIFYQSTGAELSIRYIRGQAKAKQEVLSILSFDR